MNKSVLFFTMHRSGSTVQKGILRNIAKFSGLKHRDIAPSLGKLNTGKTIHDNFGKMQFSKENVIYGPFRRLALVPEIDDFNVVLCLRDPRDTMVSMYYSAAFSHGPPKSPTKRKQFFKLRNEIVDLGIDNYVLKYVDSTAQRYIDYINFLDDKNKLVLTYEEMVTDFKSFSEKLLKACDLVQIHDKLYNEMKNGFVPPKTERKDLHKRQMLPGDHKKKLKKSTILTIDKKFDHIIKWVEKNKD